MFEGELTRQPPGHVDRDSGIDSEEILNKYIAAGFVGELSHGLADMFQHAADIGASLAGDVIQCWTFTHRFHDGIGPGGNIDLERSAFGD